jgi:hypothetical protein
MPVYIGLVAARVWGMAGTYMEERGQGVVWQRLRESSKGDYGRLCIGLRWNHGDVG